MRYVISGSQTITDEKAVECILREYLSSKDLVYVGDAQGVDAIASRFAYRYFNEVRIHVPDWEDADVLVAIWDGRSRGTKNMIDTALALNVETHVHFVKP